MKDNTIVDNVVNTKRLTTVFVVRRYVFIFRYPSEWEDF